MILLGLLVVLIFVLFLIAETSAGKRFCEHFKDEHVRLTWFKRVVSLLLIWALIAHTFLVIKITEYALPICARLAEDYPLIDRLVGMYEVAVYVPFVVVWWPPVIFVFYFLNAGMNAIEEARHVMERGYHSSQWNEMIEKQKRRKETR